MNTQYADILLNRTGKKNLFTYAVPEELAADLQLGQVVAVPLRQKYQYGVVWQVPSRQKIRPGITYKPIKKIVDPNLMLLPSQRSLAVWMSKEFVAPLAACVFSFLPVLKAPPKSLDDGIASNDLENKQVLTPDQSKALTIIQTSAKPVLLHGVTGSGKTEVYLHYAKEILNSNKAVLILVPEIALTPQTKKRFVKRFGNTVAVWHSGLSMAERRLIYWQVRTGKKTLIVGSRSALFLPFVNLGLIVIDEEHEKTFYQESAPRYHARYVAEYMHAQDEVKLILGSATPALESVWKASQGEYALAKLNERIGNAPMPESVIVDLRSQRLYNESSLFSESLLEYLQQTLDSKRQAVLLLNRRGSATSAVCTSCGTILLCKNCNVPLTVHYLSGSAGSLQCHHCDRVEPLPSVCPVCGNDTLNLRGFGTEKIEQDIKRLLPKAKVLRMDRDTTATRDIIDQMYRDFAEHKYDILLGTQMIAKGWDIPTVDLVGILMAEGGLMLPDFHAAENTFSLLVQASGRSGRGTSPGKTVIQTFQPDHPLIRLAATHSFGEFVKLELKSRKEFNYPPFSHIVRLLFQHQKEEECVKQTEVVSKSLKDRVNAAGAELLGPTPCFFNRLRGKYRYHIIIKIKSSKDLDELKQEAAELDSPWVVEIDPPQML